MKKILMLVVLISSANFSLTAQSQDRQKPKPSERVYVLEPPPDTKSWKEFTSEDGRFSIVSPGALEHSEKYVALPAGGTMKVHVFLFTANAEYGVTYCDYPFQIEGTGTVREFMDAVRDAGVKGINGRLLNYEETAFDGHPSRFYSVQYGSQYGFLLVTRTIVVGSRLYMVTTTYRKADLPTVVRMYEEWANRFRESFKLLPAIRPAVIQSPDHEGNSQ
ncbi:MAG TPA: hypothetical protein VLA93_11740 [Pyrinomonadaceae bacterium]|nr:hypothetical protein [Pyrinomonadaceae bacterium]